MDKKKILMIVQSTYPNDSRVRREAEALSSSKIEVNIICLRNENQSVNEKVSENIYAYRIQRVEDDDGILKYIFYSLKFLFLAFFYAIKLSKEKKFDLIQVHNLPDYLVFSSLYYKIKHIPIVLDLHDLTPELFKSKWKNKNRLFYKLSKVVERLSCKYANHIITTSIGFKSQLIKRGIEEDKISIILNSPSKLIKRTRIRNFNKIESSLKLIYHGTLAHRFGLHCVVEAMPIVLQKFPDSIFHMFGGGDTQYIKYLNELILKKGLSSNIKIFKSLPQDEIIDKIQEYDIGVVPYLEDEFMQLALSTKSFEYAKLFIPIVASSLNPMLNYFDNESVIFFQPGNIIDLANKIIQLADDSSLRKKITDNAFHKIKCIADGSEEKKYVDLINILIKSN